MGTKIKSYKGFNKDFTCKGYQYEVGKEYEMPEDDIRLCNKGFHACESPLEVLDYYFFDNEGGMCRFAEVEQSGKIECEESSTKVCSSRIKVKAELKFGDLIRAGVEWLKEVTRPEKIKDSDLSDKGENYAQIGSSGGYAQIGSSGDYAKIGSSGYYAQIGSSGDYAQIGSSGYSAQIGSSGDSAKIGSSGDYAKIGSSGDSAKIGSSGYSAQIESTGEDSVICCAGHGSHVKAELGSWVTLAEWVRDEKKDRYVPIKVVSFQIDGETYKPDTWYKLENGEVKEAE